MGHNDRQKSRANRRSGGKRKDWNGFINRRMSKDELEDFDQDADKYSMERLVDTLTYAVAAGYDVKFTTQDAGQTVVCTWIDRVEERAAYGYALSSFGGSWEEVLMMNLYKHQVIFQEVWLLPDPDEGKINRG